MSNKAVADVPVDLYRVRSTSSAIAASGIVEMEAVGFSNEKNCFWGVHLCGEATTSQRSSVVFYPPRKNPTGSITLFSEPWPPRGFSPFFFQTARKLANTAAQRQAAAFPPWPINR